MRPVNAQEWALLKQHSANHLTDPTWLGGGHCIVSTEVHARVMLPAGPWDAVILARATRPSGD